jgi:hypothetical protein
MSHGFIMTTPMIRVGLHRGSFFRLERHRNSDQKYLVAIISLTSGIHSFLTFPAEMRYDAEIVLHLFCLTSKEISATASAKRRFGRFTSVSIKHQLTMPEGRDKKLPEPKPPGGASGLFS